MTFTKPASQKQIDLITILDGERIAPAGMDVPATIVAGLTSAAASNLITMLISSPRKPRPVARDAATAQVAGALADVEVSKYAVPVGHLVTLPGIRVTGDLLFLEVRDYMGRRYMRRLHGAPSNFTRTKFTSAEVTALAGIIRGRHVEFAGLFGQAYTCCGRCAAPLTDQRSRETGFGPECRKAFGLK